MAGQRKRYSVELKTKVALEKAGTRWLAHGLLNPGQRATEKRRGVDRHPLPTNRPTESAGGLVGKKITSTALKPNERSLSRGILS